MTTKMTPLATRAEPPKSEALRELLRRGLQAEERRLAKEPTA
jgi:hypothetical protein